MQTRYADTPRGRMAYTDDGAGEGTPLLLVHGLPTAKELWDPVRPHLAPRRTIALDLHDYGESDRVTAPIRHPDRAATIDALRAALGLDRIVLVAHDLGASVAVDYLGDFADRVEKLVILSPPVWPDFREPAVVKLVRTPGLGEALLRLMSRRLLDRSIRRGMAHPERYTPAIAAALHRAYAGPDGRAALIRDLRWGRPADMFAAYPAIMAAITAPTLVLHGDRDPYIPREHAERMAATIPGARFELIPDAAHFLPIDAPEAVAAAINRFL
ncbi:MAG: alpha/beta fold hydrolase [Myxococcales bacterium]|nr:alpha/beta fold hydrolase [Myxococcales bacterium]